MTPNDYGMYGMQDPMDQPIGNTRTLSGRIQEILGARQPAQNGAVQQILSSRFKPETADFGAAAVQTLLGGKPVGGQDIANARGMQGLEQMTLLQKLQSGGGPGGGATGELVQRLMDEANQNGQPISFRDALYQVQTGFRQGLQYDANGNIVAAPGVPQARQGIKYAEGAGTNMADRDYAAQIAREKMIGEGNVPELQKTNNSKTQLSDIIDDMRVSYQDLAQAGGITTQKGSIIDNMAAKASGSAVGQWLGGIGGTQESRIRQDIYAKIPLLMSAIKTATGKSASEINSIPEMQLLKQSVTDPSQPIETVLKQLDDLQSFYGQPTSIQPIQEFPSGELVPYNPTNMPLGNVNDAVPPLGDNADQIRNMNQGGLTPEEQAELDQLRQRFRK